MERGWSDGNEREGVCRGGRGGREGEEYGERSMRRAGEALRAQEEGVAKMELTLLNK